MHLQRGGRVLRTDGDRPYPVSTSTAPGHIGDVQQVGLAAPWSGPAGVPARTRSARPAPSEFALRPAQRGQRAAEHAPGVEAERVVDPLGRRDRRVPVHHRRTAPVVLAPTGSAPAGRTRRSRRWSRRTDERADPAGRAALVGLLHPGVRDDQPAAVQHGSARPGRRRSPELLDGAPGPSSLQLFHGPCQAVRQQHVAAGVCGPASARGCRHTHSAVPAATMPMTSRSTPGVSGPAVDQVTDEHRRRPSGCRAPTGRPRRPGPARSPARSAATPAPTRQPCTSPMMSNGPVSSRRSLYCSRSRCSAASISSTLRSDVHLAEPLPAQAPQPAAQFALLPVDDVPADLPGRAGPRCAPAHLLGHVEHDGDRQHVVLPGQRDQLLAAVLCMLVASMTVSRPAASRCRPCSAAPRRRPCWPLVVLVVGDQPPAEVGGQHLGRLECRARMSTCRSRTRRRGPRGTVPVPAVRSQDRSIVPGPTRAHLIPPRRAADQARTMTSSRRARATASRSGAASEPRSHSSGPLSERRWHGGHDQRPAAAPRPYPTRRQRTAPTPHTVRVSQDP